MRPNFLMCDPHFYKISYEINPWMKIENQASNSLAIEQWNKLVELMRSLGAKVSIMQGEPHVPDLVFTANAALIHKHRAYLAHFFHPERQPETEIYRKWFQQNGFETIDVQNFEGAGDALFSWNDDKNLYAGYGFRSNQNSLYEAFPETTIHSLQLVDPYFYHLDTCFCPLKNGYNLVYLPAFSTDSIDKIKKTKYIDVCEEDAKKFACNAVCLGDKIIMPSGCENTYKQLEKLGFEVYHTDMSEFIKAGGACKCLTLRLDEFLSWGMNQSKRFDA